MGLLLLMTWKAAGAMPPVGAAGCAAALPAATGTPSVHVLLSPRMPYALKEWRRMADVARQAGFRVAAYRDPRVPLPEWRAAVSAEGLDALLTLAPLDLNSAQSCDMLNHAPTAVVARCGHVHPWPVRGVMPESAWRHVLAARLADLETLPCP